MVEEGARDFDEIGIWRGCRKSGLGPQLATHQGEGVGEGGGALAYQADCRIGAAGRAELVVGEERHQGEETEQRRGGAGDRTIRPLPLGLDAQVRPHLVEGHFELPAEDEPGEDLQGIGLHVGTEQGLGGELLRGRESGPSGSARAGSPSSTRAPSGRGSQRDDPARRTSAPS